ncbi:MAG: bifunctional UDP-N-acetylglucosamine diphosphorylase/glucosamine-1-phosphate N-acetyltransferase GlmU [Pseudomonadota bacterium]
MIETRRPLAIVVLAAGKGTRMRSAIPKVLHPIAGAPMLHHVLRTAQALSPARLAVVVGHGAEAVGEAAQALVPTAAVCLQAEQRGTGHAVMAALPAIAGFEGDLLVLYGDVPALCPATLEGLIAGLGTGAGIMVLGFEAVNPAGYGRLVIDTDGTLARIVEAKDANAEELAITACNSGVMAGDAATIARLLEKVGCNNAQAEYYLTDLPGIAAAEGLTTRTTFCPEAETQGVNDRVELARAEARFQAEARRAHMLAGATLTAPDTVHFAWDTLLGKDVTVGPNVVFGPGVRVGDDADIKAFCHLTECEIAPGAAIGPFARLRGGVAIGRNAHVGNFVEMKNAEFGPGAKASHLTYVGDAVVGAEANLGAGTITCNYDGTMKHRTEIGAGAFIGTNTALIAPVSVGDNAYVATGTVVTTDVPAEALAIARVKQDNREGTGRRLRQRLQQQKAEKQAAPDGQ